MGEIKLWFDLLTLYYLGDARQGKDMIMIMIMIMGMGMVVVVVVVLIMVVIMKEAMVARRTRAK